MFVSSLARAQQDTLSFHPAPGVFAQTQRVSIRGGAPIAIGGAIFYSTDGSTPSLRSAPYTGSPIRVSASQVLRAAVFTGSEQQGRAIGGSYLIGEPESELLTVSVGIDPWRLFSPTSGWFMPGPDAGRDLWDPRGANWWTHAEHPAHVDLIEADGRVVHDGTLGLRMFGGVSRMHPQKSFSLSGRKEYGNKRIDYPLFGKDAPQTFRFLVVRNGGSDWGRSFIRDALLSSLLVDASWDLDHQASRPVRVYLNGAYWGMYHLREKINPRYLAEHHPGVDKDSLSLLEHQQTLKHGSIREYRALHDFITTQDLSDTAVFSGLNELMDVDNFQRLQIAQTYFDNRDAGGNIRYWRPDRSDGRFRWILYDVDQGFGLHRQEGWTINTLAFLTDPAGPSWPNPPWSTLFQRRLLTNATYRRTFVNRTLDYLNSDFSPEAVAEQTERTIAGVVDEMPRHLRRWEQSERQWQYHLDQLRRFGQYRPANLREHFRAYFSAGADRSVSLTAGRGGYIVLNDNLHVGSDGLAGTYFANFPITLRAVPEPGYRFVGWRGGTSATDDCATLYLQEDREYVITAQFEPAQHPLADRIIIHELCPRSKAGGDWVELLNRSETPVSLKNWFLIDDSQRRYTFPDVLLPPGGYLVVCQKEERFRATYPQVPDFLPGLPFGLSKSGDRIGLYAADGSYVNALSYTLPAHPDTAFTYALTLPELDNAPPENWVVEPGPGTPGAPNPVYLQTTLLPRRTYWTRISIGVAVLLVVGLVKGLRS
ncbi:CotH kinase family protein [Neolewinella sp.]|uniref:CotH kinase family protein n=1 Tax=Neolewinella sp. TaxID=2993543 RepID=UPI003B522B37